MSPFRMRRRSVPAKNVWYPSESSAAIVGDNVVRLSARGRCCMYCSSLLVPKYLLTGTKVLQQ